MKILIAGDSWAMGEWNSEWQGPEHQILHKGLEQYLLDDNHTVTNTAKPGDGLDVILTTLKEHSKQKYDYVFVFVVDPHRDIEQDKFWIKDFTYQDYYNRHKKLIRKFVSNLEDLDIGPIVLIGGAAECLEEYVQGTKITIGIPSIIELLLSKEHQYEMCFQTHYGDINMDNITQKTLEGVYKQALMFDNIFHKEPIMYPDGEHPNREGHYKIYKVLKDKYLHATTID